MADVATIWNPATGGADWAVSAGGLATGVDVVTAVLLSLFTDRQARPDDVIPDGSGDPRGWWGDLGEAQPIGSRIWLYARAKRTPESTKQVRAAITEALQWLIDDGVVKTVDAVCTWPPGGQLEAVVTLTRASGPSVTLAYAWPTS